MPKPSHALHTLVIVLMLALVNPARSRAAVLAPAGPPPTAAEAEAFVAAAEARLLQLWIEAERASWVQSTLRRSATPLRSRLRRPI